MLHEDKDDDRHCGKEVYNPNKRLNKFHTISIFLRPGKSS
jgi:hypothetical protein